MKSMCRHVWPLLFFLFCTFQLQPTLDSLDSFFWHMPLLRSGTAPLSLKRQVTIAIFDTYFDNEKINPQITGSISDNLKNFDQKSLNLLQDAQNANFDQSTKTSVKKFDFLRQKNTSYTFNHGACVATLIKQVAPHVRMICIPIFDQYGQCSQESFLNTLKSLNPKKVDIVFLGLKIDTYIPEIVRQLKKFNFVVVAVGNDGFCTQKNPFWSHFFFCVGAFDLHDTICNFSAYTAYKKPSLVMPGKDLNLYLFSELEQAFVLHSVSGTSFAAALATGVLANFLMSKKSVYSLRQIQKVVKKNSVMKKQEWKKKVCWGMWTGG
jgi:hypothetical protein